MEYTKVITAPDCTDETYYSTSLFLAGSIDMGNAEEWQEEIMRALDGAVDYILNPRRQHWDMTIKQTADDPNLNIQVNWELDAIDNADVVAFYFAKESKAPITFLELGYAGSNRENVIVYCPDGFYRQGNVEIFCERFNIPFYKEKDRWIKELMNRLDKADGINRRFLQQMELTRLELWG